MITIPEELYLSLLKGKEDALIKNKGIDPLSATSQQYNILKYNRNRRQEVYATENKPINVRISGHNDKQVETQNTSPPPAPVTTISDHTISRNQIKRDRRPRIRDGDGDYSTDSEYMTSYEDEDNLKSAIYSENIEDVRSEKVSDEDSESEVPDENDSKEAENTP
uniref:Reverse transcriptase domain-containing protein n=1 Tax=Panagrellus redivivus TaxID=6233 RepID=A0A7E4VVP3_PANRE